MPYTERSKENLVREGIERERIFVTGNPINEVLDTFTEDIEASSVMKTLTVKPFEYFLVTLHRSENVDIPDRLAMIFKGLEKVAAEFKNPILVSVHPRTADKIEQFGIKPSSRNIRLVGALGFFDFIKLEKHSLAVLTDSGTVQEECAILGIPNITLRDVTERPETIECGSNVLCGAEPDSIVRTVELTLAQPAAWTPPREYLAKNVSQTVSKILLGFTSFRRHSS
jgi:UDP-N-acetylglucosamine 2-epimerase (non-hydrolysing)